LVERYFLLGGDVSQSASPSMMNAAFKELGLPGRYEAISVRGERFDHEFRTLSREAAGLNLTIPYKSAVIPHLDRVDPVAERIRAVNVVRKRDGLLEGYNTDVGGITESLRGHGVSRLGRAFLIGAGGAARAFSEAMSQMGCHWVTVGARDPIKGRKFTREMSAALPNVRFEYVGLESFPSGDFDLVFNATPLGAPGFPLPESLMEAIDGEMTLFDAVYRPIKTELLAAGEARGARLIPGYEMLLNQGALGFQLWTGKEAPKEPMRAALLSSLEGGP
jgi:shikimate dehydrogenase